ncbi:hypothetical protein ACWD26_36180 [Streptomyces sp. NPDC002787]
MVDTAALALLVALDRDGTTSYMIACSAFLPPLTAAWAGIR